MLAHSLLAACSLLACLSARRVQNIENTSMRNYLKMGDRHGVLITHIQPLSDGARSAVQCSALILRLLTN